MKYKVDAEINHKHVAIKMNKNEDTLFAKLELKYITCTFKNAFRLTFDARIGGE